MYFEPVKPVACPAEIMSLDGLRTCFEEFPGEFPILIFVGQDVLWCSFLQRHTALPEDVHIAAVAEDDAAF